MKLKTKEKPSPVEGRKVGSGRKVRTLYGSVAGNARPPQGEDKCNRKEVQGSESNCVGNGAILEVCKDHLL